ncbi:NHS-like protein 3 isoform X2 [Heterodontus francisci]|uniref:NHS-like protein 3 isoform X2 n=1 Tax=Heterodontus francisci TaxID=7792 RepID=UPI00355BB045
MFTLPTFPFRICRKLQHECDEVIETLTAQTPFPSLTSQTPSSVASKLDEESKWSVHYKPAQYEHQQENVFLPSTRPPHIEDLHKEAEIGLKSLQEQGNLDGYSHLRNGRDCGDDSSQHSQDEDVPHVNKSGSCAPSDEVWAKTRSLPPPTPDEIRRDLLSARSGAIPTGTTFKPQGHQKTQSSFKGPKLKAKRIRRTTIMGLPQHVQQELGFGKASHLSNTSVKVPGADSAGVVSASRGDGSRCFNNVSHSRARGSLRSVNFTASSEGDNESISTLEINDQPNWELIDFSKRPKSLAIPKSSIPSELLQSPVMSMSPQATYLSKIIPNAILPAAVDVVMINTSQNCLRTLSRNSLICAPSPACSRSNSLQNYDGKDYASSDTWSHSQSSETIVSNNSTISSQGNALNNNSAEKDREKSRDEHNLTNSAPDHRANTSRWVSTCSAQNASQITEDTPAHNVSNGYGDQALSPAQSTNSIVDVSDTQSVTSERSISRSLSVRKMKRPPVPPIRMHSLQVEEQNSELKDPSCASPGEDDVFSHSLGEMNSIRFESCVDSPAAASPLVNHKLVTAKDGMGEMSKGSILHSTNNFPAQNPTSPIKSERTISPSSGYSSQSGTPTLVRNLLSPSPPVGRSKPRTPERSSSLLSPEMSQSSSLASISSSVSEHVDLFIIPPPPSSPAPPPPTIKIAKLPTLLPYAWGAAAIPPPPAGPAPLPPTKKKSFLFAAPTVAPPVTKAASTVAPPVTKAASTVALPVTKAASTVAPPVTKAASTVAPPVTKAASTVAPPVTTTAVSTVAPPVTTTAVSTVAPPVTTTAVSTVAPPVTTTVASTVAPPVTTTAASTVAPPVTTTAASTVAPPVTTTAASTVAPPVTTTAASTVAPPVTTTAASTVAPPVTTTAASTVAPPVTTTAASTVAPPVTTTAASTVAPPVTTTAASTVAPPVTTTAASTVAPPVTTTAASTVAPPVTTTAASTVAPPVTTTAASTVAPPVTTTAASTVAPPVTTTAASTVAPPVTTTAASTVAPPVTTTAASTVAPPVTTTAASTVAPPVTTTAASTVAPPVTTKAASTVAPPVTTKAASTVAPLVTTKAASPPAAGTFAAVVLASALAPVAQHVTSTSADTSLSSAPPEQVQQKLIPLSMKLPSPPPSPPPSHHPPPPPKKTTGKTLPQSSSTVFEPTKQELSMLNWPPPPPPLSPSVFPPSMSSSSTSEKVNVSHSGKQDAEFLFPPPPPPSLLADTAQEKRSSAEDLQPLSPPAPPPLPPESTLKNTIPEQPVAAASSLPSLPLSQPAETEPSSVPQSSLSLASSPATCTSQHLQEKPLVSGIPPTVREDSQLPKIMSQTPKASNEDSEKELTVQSSPNQDAGGQASVPVVTPSLLQMVRLRSVQMSTYGPGVPDSQQPVNKNQLDLKPPTKSHVTAPSKPARKSLSLRLSSSSDSESSIKPNHSPHIKKPATTATTDVQGQTILKSPDDGAPHKSPASTASFIFSKNVSSRKLVFETPRSPEAEAAMKKNFMAELNSVSERIASKTESKNSSMQSKAVSEVPFAQKKPGRIPPPVAKKPLFLPNAHRLPSTSTDVRDLREAQDKSDALEATSDAKDEKGKLESGNGQLALCKGD